jgi:phosphoribosylformylglycinamidine synthase
VPSGFQAAGDVVYVIGQPAERQDGEDYLLGEAGQLAGSEYLRQFHGLVAGSPRIDLALEARVQRVLVEAANDRLLRSAHDCSHGGLAVTIAEGCLQHRVGFTTERVRIRGRRDAALFGEQASRVVVSVTEGNVPDLEALLARIEVPSVRIGVTGGDRLGLSTAIDLPLEEARAAYEGGLAEALDGP